jgi:cellobiose-specific phosphotransferase system component IIC
MDYIIESIFVGLYSSFIYFLFLQLTTYKINNLYITLLVVGFMKHFFGYYFGIHTYYCNNGEACLLENKNNNNNNSINNNNNNKYKANTNELLRASVGESFSFLFFGFGLSLVLTNLDKRVNRYILFFLLGFILHVESEFLGIHKIFCETNCEIDK